MLDEEMLIRTKATTLLKYFVKSYSVLKLLSKVA